MAELDFSMLLSLLCLSLTVSAIYSFPMVGHDNSPSGSAKIQNGAACNDIGEIVSDDPCRPWCICKEGVAVCAEIFCNSQVPKTCGKIAVNGRCCPTYVCMHSNGTASMHYPLPLTVVPPAMYEDESAGKENKRSPHRNHLGSFTGW